MTLSKGSHPAKVNDRVRRALVREAAKRPGVTLNELEIHRSAGRIYLQDKHRANSVKKKAIIEKGHLLFGDCQKTFQRIKHMGEK